MEHSFSSINFLKTLSEELIDNFSRAGKATTPGLVGTARESEARQKLEKILPPIVGIGSGCIIDSFSRTSKQTDIVLYEKQLCPVFALSPSAETTYYPCEGVIAVGEVKSGLDKSGLEDSFRKIISVKELQRFVLDPLSWRKYGSTLSMVGVESEKFDCTKFQDQTYGFVLCNHIDLKIDTFLQHYRDLCVATPEHLLPNLIVSLRDGCFCFLDKPNMSITMSRSKATGIAYTNLPLGNFQYLLARLNWIATHGRTTEVLPFQRYILEDDGRMPILKYIPFE